MAFQPHGDTLIEVHGRTVLLRPQGHLNNEEVERILKRIAAAMPDFGSKPWGVLYILEATTLLTPDAENSATDASPQLIAAGLAALALVLNDAAMVMMVETQVRRIYADTDCPIKVFDNEADAERWVSALIDKA